MDRVAVFVDAGYVFAQGSVLLSGKKLPRSEIVLNHEAAIAAFGEFAARIAALPLLRVYWYDGTSTGPTAQHLTLGHLDDVKVRLGFVNSVGEQKGVDSLIITDMILLARNRAMSEAVLVSGDEDLRVGVQQAQELGVRVHLVGIKPARGSQSLFLLQEADRTYEWSEVDVARFLDCKQKLIIASDAASLDAIITESSETTSGGLDALERSALKVAQTLEKTELSAIIEAFEGTRQLPRDIDRRLLTGCRSALGRDLGPSEKKRVRALFLFRCRLRLEA